MASNLYRITFELADGTTKSVEFEAPQGEPGKDYVLTAADKQEIVDSVLTELGGQPVFGYVDGNNNIIITAPLADGTYTAKYEMSDGSTIEIGELVLGGVVFYSIARNLSNCYEGTTTHAGSVPRGETFSAIYTPWDSYTLYKSSVRVTMGGVDITSSAVSGTDDWVCVDIASVTGDIVIAATATQNNVEPDEPETNDGNMVRTSVDTSGNPFNGGLGYMNGYYVSSTGISQSVDSAFVATGFMPNVLKTTSDVLYIKGAEITTDSHCRFNSLESLSKSLGSIEGSLFNSRFNVTTLETMYYKISPKDEYISKGLGNGAYFRMSLKGTGENLVISTEPID